MAVAAKSAGKAPARKMTTKAAPKAAAKPAEASAKAEPKVTKAAARPVAKATPKVAPKPAAKTATKAAAPARAAKTPAAAKRAAAAPKAAEALSWTQISTELAERHELTKRQAREILDGAIEMVAGHLRKGGKVRISGLGILSVRKREARMGRNPATGEQMRIKASKKVALRVAKELKESI